MTKELACVLAGSSLKNKMWIWIYSFRHVLVCSWFFSSASHKYRHERKSLRLFRQKALYSSWSLPSSLGGQSVAGVTGGSLTKALLVVGDTFVDAATCQRLSQISSYTVDGFLCCPTGDLPSPKDFVSDGEWRMCGNYSPPQNTTLLYVNSAVQDKQPSKRKESCVQAFWLAIRVGKMVRCPPLDFLRWSSKKNCLKMCLNKAFRIPEKQPS